MASLTFGRLGKNSGGQTKLVIIGAKYKVAGQKARDKIAGKDRVTRASGLF